MSAAEQTLAEAGYVLREVEEGERIVAALGGRFVAQRFTDPRPQLCERVFNVYRDGKLAASMLLYTSWPANHSGSWKQGRTIVESLWVSPTFRRQGLGALLLGQARSLGKPLAARAISKSGQALLDAASAGRCQICLLGPEDGHQSHGQDLALVTIGAEPERVCSGCRRDCADWIEIAELMASS